MLQRLLPAKPKSGEIFGMLRIVDLCPPSGADLCTSGRIECRCDAYAIGLPALRFRLLQNFVTFVRCNFRRG